MFIRDKFILFLFFLDFCKGLRIFQSPPKKCLNCKICTLNKFNSLKKINIYLKNKNVDDKINIWNEYDKDLDPPIIFELYNWTKESNIKEM